MEYIAHCGLRCDLCPVFIATQNQDVEMQKKLAADYSTQDCVFTPGDMECEGCFSTKNDKSKMCGECEVRRCAQEKKVENCGACQKYPCAIVEQYVEAGCEGRLLLDQIHQAQSK